MPPPRRYDDGLYDEGTYDGPGTFVDVEQSLDGYYGPVVMDFRYEERTRSNLLIQDITTAVISDEVDLDNDRAIIRTSHFMLRGDRLPASFNAEDNCVAVSMRVLRNGAFDTYQIGLFVLDDPERGLDSSYPAQAWDVQASDTTAILWRARIDSPFVVPAGMPFASAIAFQIAAAGLQSDIPSSSLSVSSDQIFAPSTARGDICESLAQALNWFRPWASRTGVITTRERTYPILEVPAVHYGTQAEPRMIIDDPGQSMVVSRNRTQFPNRIAVVVDDPYRAPFFALKENDDPQSLISVTALGQIIHDEMGLPRMVDQATADAFATYELLIADAKSQVASLKTLLDPRRDAHETYRVTFETEFVGQLYSVAGWSMKLEPGAQMRHTLRKVNDVTISSPAAPVPAA